MADIEKTKKYIRIHYGYSVDEEVNKVALYVWNATTLAWERMEQPTLEVSGDLTVSMGDVERLLAENYWKDQRLDWSGGELIYKGLNIEHKAATDETTWYIWKLTWVGGELVRKEGPLVGGWNGRAALAWG